MSLYASLLGGNFAELPAPLQLIHRREGSRRYFGTVNVVRGKNCLARLCAAAARLPPDYTGSIEVEIVTERQSEQWTRHFGAHAMRSSLRAQAGYLRERLGLLRFDFVLSTTNESIVWLVARVSILGLPLPVRWFADVHAVESVRDGRYQFDVRAQLPAIGLLIHYAGWLDVR